MIFCDESDRWGPYFSNFYGGVRIGASKINGVIERLESAKSSAGLSGEIKWGKTDMKSVEMYKKFIKSFFDEIAAGNLVMRVMFTQNSNVADGLTAEQHANEYYILYYQFLKHAFGLRFMPDHDAPPRLRFYLDEFGDTQEQLTQFRGFIRGICDDPNVRRTGLTMAMRDIVHVRSHDHILMQSLDVVLGSITFRLNDKHKEKQPGQRIRGKRTRAKEQLYKFINQEICRVTGKRFNIGISTGLVNYPDDRWSAPYLHWLFEPNSSSYDPRKTKP